MSTNLSKADIYTQQNFFTSFLSTQFLQQIENQITEDLPVYGENEDDDCCISLVEKQIQSRNPIQIRRLKIFQSKQYSNQSGTNYLNQLQKKAEFCDLPNFKMDQILSFIFFLQTQ